MKEPNQVDKLFAILMSGERIDRVSAFYTYGIADLRSRLSDVKKVYGIVTKRETKPGKGYRHYWVENKISV